MSDDLRNEVEAINSIYGEGTLHRTTDVCIYVLSIPSHPVSIRVAFPPTYPDDPPSVAGVESTGWGTRKGYGTDVLELAQRILGDVYTPTWVCLYELIQELETQLRVYDNEEQKEGRTAASKGRLENVAEREVQEPASENAHVQQRDRDRLGLGLPPCQVPQWHLSRPLTEKKSTFVARACYVRSPIMVREAMAHVLSTEKKMAKATHNISAYRIRDPNKVGVTYQDCDDDGESAAGGRLLHLLQIMDVWDVLVVVSRWYGGVKLGPDRFRLINQVGKEAVIEGGWCKRTV
ncbi:MAG: hypothetical protein Q9163_001847 [Psora crenata]